MKTKKHIKYLTVLILFISIYSCSENDIVDPAISAEELGWKAFTNLTVSPTQGKDSFIWTTNLLTFEEYWGNDIVELNLKLNSNIDFENFSKVEVYIRAAEVDGYNYTAPFEMKGKLLTTITEIPKTGEFKISMAVQEVYDLFKNDFVNDRTSSIILHGDVYTLTWVITKTDGEVFDSSEKNAIGYSYGFSGKFENYAPPVWEDTYDYEWIAVSSNTILYGGRNVGDTGTITITSIGNGNYEVSDLIFGINYFGGPGILTYDFSSGLTTISGPSSEKWVISNVFGSSLYIDWTNSLSAAYGIDGTVRLTRQDGADWPDNVHTN